MDGKQKFGVRNISLDQLYTSFTLAAWILNKKDVICIGALMENRKGIPLDVNKIQPHEIQSTKFYWDEEHYLVKGCYIVSLSTKKKKNALLLSTFLAQLWIMIKRNQSFTSS